MSMSSHKTNKLHIKQRLKGSKPQGNKRSNKIKRGAIYKAIDFGREADVQKG